MMAFERASAAAPRAAVSGRRQTGRTRSRPLAAIERRMVATSRMLATLLDQDRTEPPRAGRPVEARLREPAPDHG